MSEHEDLLAWQLKAAGIGGWVREYRFAPQSAHRFDFAWPVRLVAVEVDGWGHHHLNRFQSDHAKLNLAVLCGWRVLRVFPAEIASGEALQMIEKLLTTTETGAALTQGAQP